MKSLREVIRQLPPGVEVLVVIMWAFGMPIFTSILSLGQPHGAVVFSDAVLIGTVVFELMVAAGLASTAGAFLVLRRQQRSS